MIDDIQIIAVPDCKVVRFALYGVLSVVLPQLTMRLPIGPLLASDRRSTAAVRSSKLVLNTVIKMQEDDFCLNFYTNVRNTNLGGMKLYTSATQLGLNYATITDITQVITAMPDLSILRCSSDAQLPKVTFPTAYGTLEIKRINNNRVSLKYYVSGPAAKGRTYTGSYHSNNGFSGWYEMLETDDLDNRFTVVGNNTAMQTAQAATMYRIQISSVGNLSLFKSTDGGKTWPQSKAVASFETT